MAVDASAPIPSHRAGALSRARPFAPWLLAALLWPAILPFPWTSNTGEFALMASRWAAGARLYRDIADNRPPLIYLVWRVALAIGGGAHAHVLLELAVQAATLGSLLFVARRAWGAPLALRAGLVYVVTSFFYLRPDMIGESESVAMPLVLATIGIAAAADAGRMARPRALATLGAIGGAMFALKLVPILLPAAAVGWLLIRSARDANRARTVQDVGAFAAGVAAVLAPFAIWMAANGTLAPFVRVFAEWRGPGLDASNVVDRIVWGPFKALYGLVLLSFVPAGILAVLALVRMRKKAARTAADELTAILLVTALLVVVIQAKFYGYHFLLAVPPAALLAGRWWEIVDAERASQPATRRRAVMGALIAVIVIAGPILRRAGAWLDSARLALGTESREAYDAGFDVPGIANPADDAATAAHLRADVGPGARVLVWGFAPHLYWLSGTVPASRYIEHLPYTCRNCSARLRDELMEELTAAPPARILVHADELDATDVQERTTAPELLARFGALQSFLNARYRLVCRDGHFDVYAPAAP